MIKLQNFDADYKQIRNVLNKKISILYKHHKYIMGPEIYELEKKLSKFSNYKYCVTVGNGTDALFLSLISLNIKKGSEVLVPAMSWISSASVILLAGLKPVFLDIDRENACVDYKKIESKISKNTGCLITVNLYGNKPNYNEIIKICKRNKIKIIEDAAQSFGSINNEKVKKNIEIMCTSFFPAKTLGCYGDGGACFTDNTSIYNKLNLLKILGQKKKSYSILLGVNSRLDSYQACVLLSKLGYYKKNLKKRYEIAKQYKYVFDKLNIISLIDLDLTDNTCTSFPILVSNRKKFINYMKKFKIETGINYPYSLIEQPIFKKYMNKEKHKNSIFISDRVVCLPINPFIKKNEIKYIVNIIKKFIFANNGI